ncbi:hypothetical protein TNCV_118771 [Trichonephila clavipes]|nr:hypothetical protein TNCV_118771 [Trichonephila clavipes]
MRFEMFHTDLEVCIKSYVCVPIDDNEKVSGKRTCYRYDGLLGYWSNKGVQSLVVVYRIMVGMPRVRAQCHKIPAVKGSDARVESSHLLLWGSVVVRREGPAQVSPSSLDHASKLRGPSPKVLV